MAEATLDISSAAAVDPTAREADHAAQRIDELMQVIDAYNRVTVNLQRTHETLSAQVVRLQGELASANAALQRSKRLAALGEMAAGIAHEVRNPLTSIQLYAGHLVEDLAPMPAQQETARRIGSAVRGLNAVVTDVLSFARELKPTLIAAPIAATLRRACEAMRPEIDAAGVALRFEVDDALCVAHDGELLHRALINLIRNAIEAMAGHDADNGKGRTLTLATETDGGVARVVVRDTGPGISDEAIERIFNPFFTTRATGTGLGLAIVHRIIDAHGGSIEVHNDGEAGGAVFTLLLPITGGGAAQQDSRGD